jgi:hypothetical protein
MSPTISRAERKVGPRNDNSISPTRKSGITPAPGLQVQGSRSDLMQKLTSSTSVCGSSFTERAQRHKDGSVLLSIADDRICKLNGVGALTWLILEENPAGLRIEDLVQQLCEQFEAINAEGELRYDVSQKQLHHDTAQFLQKTCEMNLLRAETDRRGQQLYSICEGVSGTTTSPVVDATPEVRSASRESEQGDVRLSKREIFIAFATLLGFDLLLKFRGFQSLIERVRRWPTASPGTTDRELCKRVRAIVDRAQIYYPKKAMCLQHSAVVTCLLRRRGVPAEMVLAAQEFPPKGHAWVEVEGQVVNDSQVVKRTYRVLKRV